MAKHPYLPTSLRRRIERMPRLQQVLWALEAALISTLWGLLRLLDPDRSVRAARAVASRIGPRLRKSRNIQDNLAIMFPERSAAQRAQLEREVWGEWGAMFADFAQIDRIYREQRIEVVRRAPQLAAFSGRSAVFVSTHLVNPHLSAWAGERLGVSPTALYRPLSNPIVERRIERRRGAGACDLMNRDGAMREVIRALSSGKSVALVVDNRYDEGEMVPFFGVDTPTLTTPARLALRFECELVPVRVERLEEGARFRVTFYDAVRPSDPGAGRSECAFDMTRQLNAIFEQWIRERPEQWVVAKRRWPRRGPGAAPPAARVPSRSRPVSSAVRGDGRGRADSASSASPRSHPGALVTEPSTRR